MDTLIKFSENFKNWYKIYIAMGLFYFWVFAYFVILTFYTELPSCKNIPFNLIKQTNLYGIFALDCDYYEKFVIFIYILHKVSGDASGFLVSGVGLLTSISALIVSKDFMYGRKILKKMRKLESDIESTKSHLDSIDKYQESIASESLEEYEEEMKFIEFVKNAHSSNLETKLVKLEELKIEYKFRRKLYKLDG